MSYLEDGQLVARALFLRKFSADYGGRSFIYCLGILPFHWSVTPWPVVALLVMESIVETKASSILQFIHGLLGMCSFLMCSEFTLPRAYFGSSSDRSNLVF